MVVLHVVLHGGAVSIFELRHIVCQEDVSI